ncbi:MAG: hypothetical protein ABI218_10350 [Caldimonas sp.]
MNERLPLRVPDASKFGMKKSFLINYLHWWGAALRGETVLIASIGAAVDTSRGASAGFGHG